MTQLELFDEPATVAVADQDTEPDTVPTDPGERLATEYARGEFAFWDRGTAERWKATAPPRPTKPRIPSRKWPNYVLPHLIDVRPNSRCPSTDYKARDYDEALKNGRSYLVGDSVPMETFIARHRSPLNEWQKVAYEWAKANPFYRLGVETPGHEWEIYCEGNYVMFALPHQDMSGERHYVTRDGRTKVLVNVD